MATYLVTKEIPIIRQEGDTGDIEITVPNSIDLTQYEIYFAVFNRSGKIIEKANADWGRDLQKITANLTEADTKGKYGQHRWELEIYNATEVHTIGRGDFIINRELINDVRH